MLNEIFSLNGKSSLTIVLDRTASMGGVIDDLKKFLPMYILRRYAMELESLALVTFDDHYPGQPLNVGMETEDLGIISELTGKVINVYPPTGNLEEYMYWLSQVKLGGGDDLSEAISCALASARVINPNSSTWLVTDAVPHGVLTGQPDNWDNYENGCPCGVKLDTSNINVLLAGPSVWGETKHYWENECLGRVVEVESLAQAFQDTRELVPA